jgi:hypothetical protein
MIRRKKREPVGHGGIGRTRCVGGVGDQRPHNPSKAEVYSSFCLSVCLLCFFSLWILSCLVEFASVSDLCGGVLGFLVYYRQERERGDLWKRSTTISVPLLRDIFNRVPLSNERLIKSLYVSLLFSYNFKSRKEKIKKSLRCAWDTQNFSSNS